MQARIAGGAGGRAFMPTTCRPRCTRVIVLSARCAGGCAYMGAGYRAYMHTTCRRRCQRVFAGGAGGRAYMPTACRPRYMCAAVPSVDPDASAYLLGVQGVRASVPTTCLVKCQRVSVPHVDPYLCKCVSAEVAGVSRVCAYQRSTQIHARECKRG